jgi:microcystin-dependent protein
MAEPFLAEIRIMSFNFAPSGWAFCNGQLLPINQNQDLFSLLGTTYGGDGRVNFALPDFRGRVPMHEGGSGSAFHVLGERGGEQTHTLSIAEIPSHVHSVGASSAAGSQVSPAGGLPAKAAPANPYAAAGSPTPMNAASIATAGGSQAHLNMQPFLVLNFCIALIGIFPSPN